MKRTKVNLKLKRQLELVRTTIRQLTPPELRRVNGGGEEEYSTNTCPTKCRLTICVDE